MPENLHEIAPTAAQAVRPVLAHPHAVPEASTSNHELVFGFANIEIRAVELPGSDESAEGISRNPPVAVAADNLNRINPPAADRTCYLDVFELAGDVSGLRKRLFHFADSNRITQR